MRSAIYLWCPSYALADDAQRVRAQDGAAWLGRLLKLPVVESPLLASSRGAHTWHDAKARAAELAVALDHRVLLSARGGYGAIDLVGPLLRAAPMPAGVVIGYSDATVLHACWRVRGWRGGLYGFMPVVPHGPRCLAGTAALLTGQRLVLDQRELPEVLTLRPGRATGTLFPACLRVLAGLVGTPAMPDLTGCILALEDIDERPYRVARDLAQLELAGALSGIRGLIGGRFPCDLPQAYAGPSTSDLLRTCAERLGIPAISGLPFGHEDDPVPLPVAVPAELACAAHGWRLEADAVAMAE